MLQRSWVQWQCIRGRETQPTSAVRWRLTPEPQSFGSETASSCPLPTPPTWRSTTHQPSATWRSAAPHWHKKSMGLNRTQRHCFCNALNTEILAGHVSFQIFWFLDFVCTTAVVTRFDLLIPKQSFMSPDYPWFSEWLWELQLHSNQCDGHWVERVPSYPSRFVHQNWSIAFNWMYRAFFSIFVFQIKQKFTEKVLKWG